MKHFYKFTLLIVALFVTSLSASGDEHFYPDGKSHDFEADGIFYNIIDSVSHFVEVTYKGDDIYEYSGEYSGDVVIPETVTYSGITYTVTEIGCRAFSGCSSLTSLFIPRTIEWIEMPILSYYGALESIVVDDENPVYDSRENCNAIIAKDTSIITLVAGCKTTVIPNTVNTIGQYAFHGCPGLESMEIPASVTEIFEYAFYDCNDLRTVDFAINTAVGYGDSGAMLRIRESAFEDCDSLSSVELGKLKHLMYIDKNAFSRTNLSEVEIPNSVRIIGERAFLGLGLEVKLPESLVEIGSSAFAGHRSRNIGIPDSVKKIGDGAFGDGRFLEEVTIGKSVTEIGRLAFNAGRGSVLTSVTSLNPVPPTCGIGCFSNVSTCRLSVPAGAKDAYSVAEVWGSFVNIVEIATVEVSTKDNRATFEIPTTEGAATYTIDVYADAEMAQLVASTNYDVTGAIVPMSTSLELSLDVFGTGTYYYMVTVKSSDGEDLNSYNGTFEIETSGIGMVVIENEAEEVARYDVHGRLLNAPSKGVNIVVYGDGSVRKSIVR